MTESRPFKFNNSGVTTLSSAINAVVTSVPVVTGSEFPAPAAGEIVTLVLRDDANNKFEIMNLTARSGNNLTVERGAEGTTAQSWPSGTTIRNSLTAAFFEKLAAPGPDRFRTSKPYPYIFDDSLDIGGSVLRAEPSINLGQLGESGDNDADALDISCPPQSGVLDVLLVSYDDGVPDELDIGGAALSGILASVLVSYDDGIPDELDIHGAVLSGVLDVVLVTYPNYQVESLDIGGSALSGVLS